LVHSFRKKERRNTAANIMRTCVSNQEKEELEKGEGKNEVKQPSNQ
jgi:hypothetical protein